VCSANPRNRLASRRTSGTASRWPPSSTSDGRSTWGYANASVYSGDWGSAFANLVRRSPMQTRRRRRCIKKTPSTDGRPSSRTLGPGRGSFPAAWLALQDVGTARGVRSRFPAPSDPEAGWLLWRGPVVGRAISLPARDWTIQRADLLAVPALTSPDLPQQPGLRFNRSAKSRWVMLDLSQIRFTAERKERTDDPKEG